MIIFVEKSDSFTGTFGDLDFPIKTVKYFYVKIGIFS